MEFPELPPTLWARIQTPPSVQAPRMQIVLPADYRREHAHPLLVFLHGGAGPAGSPADADYVRRICGNRGFVGVSLPLFKKDVDPAEVHGGIMIYAHDDYPLIAACYRKMLGRLFKLVPNLASGAGSIGGFSNGAHTAAVLLSAVDPFTLRHFRNFYLIDGGFQVLSLHKLAVRRKRILHLVGGSRRERWRRWMLDHLAGIAGRRADHTDNVTLIRMAGVGHAFPEDQIPTLRAWLVAGLQDVPVIAGG